jgi:hypothetical protein
MQRERTFRIAIAATAVAFGNFLSCTGYIERPGGGATSDASPPSAEQSGDAGDADRRSGGSSDRSGVPSLAAVSVAWPSAVGTWCGPSSSRSLWLTVKPQASACDAASHKLYGDAEDTSEGVTLGLDPLALTTFPAVLDVPARYCDSSQGCVDVRASLRVDSYTTGQGIKGSWAISPPGRAELSGAIDATWCNWDDFLPAHPEAERLARDIKLREVSVYQGVKVPIMRDLQAVSARNADLVQEREALLRIFVEPGPGFQSRALSARVTLQDEGEKPRHFEQSINVSGPSSETDGSSTFNLELPKDAFHESTQYSVELRETSRCSELFGTAVGARFPETGLLPVAARYTGPIKVMLVPVRYQADGSGRLPDTSPEQLAQMSRRLYAMYPTSEVMLSVHDSVETDRTDLGDMLDQIRELRVSEAPPTDLSYYGMVRQAETFSEYCQGACTTGIAGFGSQTGTAAVGMGVGFANGAADTFVHELGHIYRRPHAPCGGASTPDEAYPYPDAGLGSWGYDFQTRELFDPATHVDFMSYCSPDWISDYNYQLILERIIVVNRHAVFRRFPGARAPTAFRTLRVTKNGQARWGLDLQPLLDPPGDPVTLQALDAKGGVLEEFRATFEDGADGEQAFFVPAGHADWQAIQVPGGPAVPYAEVTQNKPFKR